MLKVRTIEGVVFKGTTAHRIVAQMRDAAWMAGEAKTDYMAGVADRVEQSHGERIHQEPRGFLEDLERLGFLRVDEY